MASSSSSSASDPVVTSHPTNGPPIDKDNPLIAININQLQRLTPSNFPSWSATFTSLLYGYNLMGYLDDTLQCPSLPDTNADTTARARFNFWFHQDQLLLNAILASVADTIAPLIATSATSREAWQRLKRLYANRSRTRVMQLKESLTMHQRGDRSVSEYMQAVKATVDELTLIDAPLSSDDITLYVLHGLGLEFRDVVAPIRTRESTLSFEELHDILLSHEVYLKRLDASNQSAVVTTNTASRRDGQRYQRHNGSRSTRSSSEND